MTKLFKKGGVKCQASADTFCFTNSTALALKCTATSSGVSAAPRLAVSRCCCDCWQIWVAKGCSTQVWLLLCPCKQQAGAHTHSFARTLFHTQFTFVFGAITLAIAQLLL